MMLGSAVARLLLTIVFAATALGAALPAVRPARLRPADWTATGFCIAMCSALIAMAWWSEPASAVWLQVAVFGGTAVWLVLAGPARTGLHYVVMAAAMTWMLTAVPIPGPMAGMAGDTPSVPVLAVSGLVAASCVASSVPWVTRALAGPGLRLADPRAASQAAMSVGMALMLVAMF
jgi:hypothetical protein